MTREDEATIDENARPPAVKYTHGRELGRGALGRVYLSFDGAIEREVAIKELLDPRQGADRFVREAKLTGQLDHPGVVPIYELGWHPDGRAFYAMKVVRGKTLRELLDAATSLDDRLRRLPEVLRIAQTMAHAHARGVIHRDLKPANVMVGEHGETFVLDWGLAKHIGAREDLLDAQVAATSLEATKPGAPLGTPAYMSPEQARGAVAEIDEASDVWCIGVILFEVLTGDRPFKSESIPGALVKIMTNDRPSVRVAEPRVPKALATICERCLATDRRARYPDAGALAEDLEKYIAGGIVQAHRYSPLERASRWVKEHRAQLALATLFTFVGAFIGLWGYCSNFLPAAEIELPPDTADIISAPRELERLKQVVELPANGDNAAVAIIDATHRCLGEKLGCMPYPWFDKLALRSPGTVIEATDEPKDRTQIPEVDRVREAARAGRYQSWGAVIFPQVTYDAHALPILNYRHVRKLVRLGLIRARQLEVEGDVEAAAGWYDDLFIVGHHLERDILIGLVTGMACKQDVSVAAAAYWQRRGDKERAARWARYAEHGHRRIQDVRRTFKAIPMMTAPALHAIRHQLDALPGMRSEAYLMQMTRAHYTSPIRLMFGATPKERADLLEEDPPAQLDPSFEMARVLVGVELERGFFARLRVLFSRPLA